jgi:hypothetical protein
VTWHLQVLAEPLLYRRITLRGSAGVLALCNTFLTFGFADNSPARWVRSIVIEFGTGRFVDDIGPPDLVIPLTTLVTYASKLVEFELLKRSMPPSVLAVLQHPGRSRLTHLGIRLSRDYPTTITHVSVFQDLQELRLWLPNCDGETLPLIAADASPWVLPRLAELRVHVQDASDIDMEQLLGFLSRCSFVGLLRFSWINLGETDEWNTHALVEFLCINPTITDLRLRVVDDESNPLLEILSVTICPCVTVIAPEVDVFALHNPLSPQIRELVLESCAESDYWVWYLLDFILKYLRETDSLRRIVIAKWTKNGTFGWHDERSFNDDFLVVGRLATYGLKLRRKGVVLLDGYGMEMLLQLAPP